METGDSEVPLSLIALRIVILAKRSDAMKLDIAKVTLDVEDEWDMDYFPRH
jgi:hypothetical protein